MKKRLKILLVIAIISIIIIQVMIINAENYSNSITITLESFGEFKAGEEINLKIKTSDTSISVDTIDGFLNYDREIFEEVTEDDMTPGLGWNYPYFNSMGSFIITRGNSKRKDQVILSINLKIKEEISLNNTQIVLEDIEAAFEGVEVNVNNQATINLGENGNIHNEDLYLSTIKYKIGTNDVNNYELGDQYLYKVESETTLEQFISNIDTNGDIIKVIKRDNTELNNDEYIGTGMTLLVTKDEQTIELKLAVNGDINGDGRISITDLTQINKHIIGIKEVKQEFELAADLNDSGDVTIKDLTKMNKILLGIY